ncbi:MAG: glycoside hydrolase [Actinobacteria bacterium]|nr:glycoside hydrolase [Actinomycetota bacterium]
MSLTDDALAVLERNDMGEFVKPSQRLYPWQWNWDSAFVVIGLAGHAPERARTEVRSLLRGQWADGMIPHMVFHPQPVDYRPGPELWGSDGCEGAPPVATSGLIAPPVLATAARVLHEAAPDQAFLDEVVPKLEAWHQWFHRERTDAESGLMVIFHGWESADNAPRFDRALARIDIEGVEPIQRTDTGQIAADERPTDLDYRRYLALVYWLRDRGYRPAPPSSSPFAYLDLPLNSILSVAEDDLAFLQAETGADSQRARDAAARVREALGAMWDEDAGAYRERDLHGEEGVTGTVADLFPLYAGVPDDRQARRLVDEHLLAPERYGPSPTAPWAVTTVSKSSPDFDPRNYWRGPVWINVNWFLVRGLERFGFGAEADELRRLTLELVTRSGFSEYYEPTTGAALGTNEFSWSASLTLDLLRDVRP